LKILAIEHDFPGVSDEQFVPLLREEAICAWELYCSGAVRELYFRADRTEAVLVLECADLDEARTIIASLPLVRHHLIEFELIPLAPYPGFERLFASPENGEGSHPWIKTNGSNRPGARPGTGSPSSTARRLKPT
jgi:muconolactone delta-isomerase